MASGSAPAPSFPFQATAWLTGTRCPLLVSPSLPHACKLPLYDALSSRPAGPAICLLPGSGRLTGACGVLRTFSQTSSPSCSVTRAIPSWRGCTAETQDSRHPEHLGLTSQPRPCSLPPGGSLTLWVEGVLSYCHGRRHRGPSYRGGERRARPGPQRDAGRNRCSVSDVSFTRWNSWATRFI